jgi:L-cysteate sulfo-lyase
MARSKSLISDLARWPVKEHRLKSKYRRRLAALPRVELAHLPTPLDRSPRAAAALNIGNLYVKREDCTGLAFGGNKVRQHEYVLGKAIANGSTCLIQGAASQSNHSRQIAAAGAKLGLRVILTPKKDHNFANVQGNFLIDQLLGCEILPIEPDASSREEKERLARVEIERGGVPYISGMGATDSLILGAVAAVEIIFEISDSLRKKRPPTWIFTASQGSTQAGLLLGCEILGWDTKVIGINPLDSSHEAFLTNVEIMEIMASAAKLIGYKKPIDPSRISNDVNYVGAKYGIPSPESIDAMKFLASNEGIILDPIYSGKAFAGLMDYAARSVIGSSDDVVFIHTGGLPGIFANNEVIANHLIAPR